MAQPSHPSSSLVDFVPLMRSPATWTPQPVILPPDIHPLPDDISAYFVYPYTLEDFVLNPPPPHVSHAERIQKLHEAHEGRMKFLREREEDKLRRRKEALRKVAPGYEPPDDLEEREGSGGDRLGGLVPSGSGTSGPTMGVPQDSKRRSGILEPTRKPAAQSRASLTLNDGTGPTSTHILSADAKPPEPRDVMDDLVEGLAQMDQMNSHREAPV